MTVFWLLGILLHRLGMLCGVVYLKLAERITLTNSAFSLTWTRPRLKNTLTPQANSVTAKQYLHGPL